MATKGFTYNNAGFDNTLLFKWVDLADGDDGEPMSASAFADKTVQAVPSPVAGSFGGGAVVIEGSHDKVNWATLSDLQGNSLSLNNTRLEVVPEHPLWLRPRVSSGSGVKLDVYVLVKGS
jgi:hypothetical protein